VAAGEKSDAELGQAMTIEVGALGGAFGGGNKYNRKSSNDQQSLQFSAQLSIPIHTIHNGKHNKDSRLRAIPGPEARNVSVYLFTFFASNNTRSSR